MLQEKVVETLKAFCALIQIYLLFVQRKFWGRDFDVVTWFVYSFPLSYKDEHFIFVM